MQKFDIVTIRLFVAIVRAGSINEAARREHIATSAVSRRIGELEAMLGVKLLRRLPRGVEPTEEGTFFARYGEKLPNFLADFERDFPHITVDVRELTSRESAEAVREGRADLAILADNSPLGSLAHEVFCDDPIWVVTPKGHPLIPNAENPKPVTFANAAKYDIISLFEGGVIDDLISEAAAKLKLDMHPHIRVVRFGSLRQMIAAGLGIGFLRKSSVAGYLGDMNIAGAPIADDWAKRQLLIAHEGDANLTIASRLFLDYLLKKSAETSFKPVLG